MAINYNTNVPSVWIVYGFRNHLSVISCDRRHCPWSRLLQGPLEKSQSKYNSQYKGDTQMRAVHQFSQKVEMYFLNTQEKIPLGKTTFPLGLFIMFTDLRINVNPEQKKETILNIRFIGSAWISQDHESVGIRCPYSHTAVLQVLILHLSNGQFTMSSNPFILFPNFHFTLSIVQGTLMSERKICVCKKKV